MISILLIITPFISAIGLLFLKKEHANYGAFIFSIPNLILAIVAAILHVQNTNHDLLSTDFIWIPDLNIHFKVGIDGINIALLLLTNLLTPLIILSTFSTIQNQNKALYMLILSMHAALNGVFMAMDMFLYYVCWEAALIPIYFILFRWGGENKEKITIKFFLYTLVGSLFMLAGIILLYIKTGSNGFGIEIFYTTMISENSQKIIFILLFAAYAVKIPIFPFHSWQPETYTQAPTVGTMLLSGIMLKMGLYSIIRWLIPITPIAISDWGDYAMILCLIGVLYGGIIAIKQKHIKTLLAYSSLSHVGLIALGLFSLSIQGIQGALIQMVSHGINVVGLFLIADSIQRRTGTYALDQLGGIRQKSPFLATTCLIIVLGSIGLPLTNGFVGEFLILLGIYPYYTWIAVLGSLTIVLGAVYMLRLYQKIFLDSLTNNTEHFSPLHWSEKTILGIITILVIIIGVYPDLLLQLTNTKEIEEIKELINRALPDYRRIIYYHIMLH